MIAELTPIHETRVGQELLEEGRREGHREGAANLVRRMAAKSRTPAEIAERTDLSGEEIALFLEQKPD